MKNVDGKLSGARLLFAFVLALFTVIVVAVSFSRAALPPIENAANQQVLSIFAKNVRFSSSNTNMQDSLYCGGYGVLGVPYKDTTMVYRAWRYTGYQAIVHAAEDDSVRLRIVYLIGTSNSTSFNMVRWDSLDVDTNGVQTPVTLHIPVCGFFAIEVYGRNGNGEGNKVRIVLNREGGR